MTPYPKVAFYTLGCKLNFSETSTISRQFQEAGFAIVDFEISANVYIINTCSVTEMADKKCRNIVNRAIQKNPDAKIIVIGCYAQLKPKIIAEIPGVSLVLGANEKFNIISFLKNYKKNNKIIHSKISQVKEFFPSYSINDRTRTFFKIQDGCDYFCSFCTIPLARGKSRSATIKETLITAKKIENQNVKEIVLTGVNIGEFGIQNNENFYSLIQKLDLLNIERFRISSIEPNLISDEIIYFTSKSKKFVPHFHIPLQSGSDRILNLMNRKYTSKLYENRIDNIKKLMPNACIGVDIIVGFPGETEEDFNLTFNFLNRLNISYLHVFTYSSREKTLANKMPNQICNDIKHYRNKRLRILSNKKKRAFYESQKNKKKTVLWEGQNNNGYLYGFTENYIRVKTNFSEKKINSIETITLDKLESDCVYLI